MDDLTELQRLGHAIRQFRTALNLSQDTFADRIDMHRAYYGAIERGVHNITIATLVRVCDGLGTKPSDVLKAAAL